jgi:glyoxylate reductase
VASAERKRRLVVGEDCTEFRLLRAACGDRSVHEWLASWLAPERIDAGDYLKALEPLGSGWETAAPEDRAAVAASLADADALIVEREPVDDELLRQASARLRTVARFGTATTNVDLDLCARLGIDVRTVSRPTSAAVAEHALMLLLVVARHFTGAGRVLEGDDAPPPSAPSSEAGGHPRTIINWKGVPTATLLAGRRLGVLGAGEAGKALMRRAVAFEMEVGYWNRTRDPELERDVGARFLELSELPRWADVVSVHLAYAPELRHVVDAAFLDELGPRGILVNTARGLLVDIDALESALRAGRLAGAGLDVYPNEPHVPRGLFELPNVALTPHIAAGGRWLLVEDVRAVLDVLG